MYNVDSFVSFMGEFKNNWWLFSFEVIIYVYDKYMFGKKSKGQETLAFRRHKKRLNLAFIFWLISYRE